VLPCAFRSPDVGHLATTANRYMHVVVGREIDRAALLTANVGRRVGALSRSP
jgi:hypothetical protein